LFGCDGRGDPALEPRLLHDEAEISAYLKAFPYEEYEIYEVPDLGKFYIDDNPALVKKKLRSGKPWEPHLIERLDDHIVPGTTVIDVGAHIGALTVPLAHMVGPEGRVYAFEPQRKLFRELVHNIRINELSNAIPLRFAASAEPGIIEMNPTHRFDGQTQIGMGGDKAEARTIDSFRFSNVSLIKIDVEGHEAAVLKGAKETIQTFHPAIFIEIWKRNLVVVRPILEEFGYSLEKISRHDYVGTFTGSG
jgi:FkbM family methyltransferase